MINAGILHAIIVIFGQRWNPEALWSLLPTHLQHYKQLILTPEQCGGREGKKGKDSSEHMIHLHTIIICPTKTFQM